MRLLGKYLKFQIKKIIPGLIFAVISSLSALAAPYVLGRTIDILAEDYDAARFWTGCLMLLVLYILSGMMHWFASYNASQIAYGAGSELRKDIFGKINSMPLKFFDTHKSGDIISVMVNDTDNIIEGLVLIYTKLVMGLVSAIGILVVMLILDLYVALAILLVTPLSLVVARFVVMKSGEKFSAQQEITGELNAYAEEMIKGYKTVKAYGQEEDINRKFKSINSRLYNVGQKAQWYSSLINPSTRLVNHLAYILVGAVSSIIAISADSHITVGLIASFLLYATQFAKPINEIADVVSQLQSARASVGRVGEIMEIESEEDVNGDGELEILNGKVAFRNVTFTYDTRKKLIENLNFDVPPDGVVAIVGPTGAGKTTLVNLLMRYYDCNSGKIFIDGTDIASVSRQSVRRAFSMVLQDSWIFEGSIRDNIAYGNPGASFKDVVNAAKEAHAHNFIKRLPDGYDTILHNNGSELSHGQRQLITIARAMLVDAELLILDEATSSVDVRTEVLIREAFRKVMKNKTTFVIAHRLHTIANADLILVMEKGNIVQQGTHYELLDEGGLYGDLWQ